MHELAGGVIAHVYVLNSHVHAYCIVKKAYLDLGVSAHWTSLIIKRLTKQTRMCQMNNTTSCMYSWHKHQEN
jgi:hypothetical protein